MESKTEPVAPNQNLEGNAVGAASTLALKTEQQPAAVSAVEQTQGEAKTQTPPTPAPQSSAVPSKEPVTGTRKPALAIVLAAVVFTGLAGMAYYAYIKTK